MYKKDLDTLLYSKNLPNYILLRSNDEFQNELYAKEILNYFGNENLVSFYYDEYSFEQAKNTLEPSLFGDKNIVYIKTNRCVPTKEIKVLIELCKKSQNNYLIYELFEDMTKISNDFIKAFEKNFVRFFKPNNENEALALMLKKTNMLNLNANTAALLQIYKIHNENLNLVANELEKFAMLGIDLSLENMQKMVYPLSEVSFEEIFNKIINLQDFRDEFFRYIQSGSYNESEFLNYMYSAFFKIFKVHSYIKINGKFDAREILGYIPPTYVQNELKNQALKFNTILLKNIFIHLNNVEYSLKSKQKLDKTNFMLSSLLKLQRIIANKNSKSKI
ncbi:DNA polymerase III, delta subunit [Campylobacter blaseri]|uniref:DNA polymerase III subunit delta n=1 Tax=Campylobacter blaseri TaxID=2042961 RepID=A0A2P8R215_9BACT|nr:DNA polymerase III subunit delta [Campylobacter blaseri]PSM52533.1 DNA polymerase III subunit delta [Campylobacter blaseri]PSM54181.1 DNA polymerase III subunit delta [Campylobacter blaseri]QKF85831.1 DNA polymerase III, delta subunit [Campylobacter blaseri]